MISRLGARESTVSNRKIWTVVATSPGRVAVPTPIFSDGSGTGADQATPTDSKISNVVASRSRGRCAMERR